jgi:hypothetical protein
VWQPFLYSLFLRYDQKSRTELVQHADLRQSDEGGSTL